MLAVFCKHNLAGIYKKACVGLCEQIATTACAEEIANAVKALA